MPVMTSMNVVEAISSENVRRVSLEEANEYIELTRVSAPKIANGVSACILSPVLLIFLSGLTAVSGSLITDSVAAAIGVIVLLVMVATAVYVFIVYGSRLKKYEYIEKEIIETAYGVDGMVQERMKSMESRKTSYTAIGVLMCILSSVPLLICACLNLSEFIIVSMVCVLIIIIAIAVNIFVRVGSEWKCCEQLLQVGEYTSNDKRVNKRVEKISGIYWAVVLAGYLAWSFITMRWDNTWIVWPVAAVFFGAITCVIKAIYKDNN